MPVSYGIASRDHLVSREEGERVVAHLAQGELWTPEGSHALESIEPDALAGHIRVVAEAIGRLPDPEVRKAVEEAEAEIDRGEGLSFREAFGEEQ